CAAPAGDFYAVSPASQLGRRKFAVLVRSPELCRFARGGIDFYLGIPQRLSVLKHHPVDGVPAYGRFAPPRIVASRLSLCRHTQKTPDGESKRYPHAKTRPLIS